MHKSYRLHYAPDNASLCVRLALEEMAVPYTAVLVDRAVKAQKSSPYLALNPNGLIPVLETADGPMFETAAILLHLSEVHGALIPGGPRQYALQWLFWMANTLHPTQRMQFYPEQYGVDQAMTRARLPALLNIINAAHKAPWLDTDAPTIQGCYLGPLLRWCALYGGNDGFTLAKWPRLLAFAQRIEQRPASLRAARAEGLGATPFSSASPPNPPEGSAL